MARHGRKRSPWGLVLAGAILALSALGGPGEFHQHATAQDFHACPIHHWTHGAGTGATTSVSVAAPLSIVGSATPGVSGIAPDVWHHPTSSRAPPATA
jgi:hypothetical protein